MIRTVLAVAASVLLVAACSKESTPPAAPAGAPAPAAAPAPGGAKASIDNPKSLYTLASSATPVKAGQTGKLTLAVQPKEGAHVKGETPFRTKLSATGPVELSKTELGYADNARIEHEGPVFEVPFQAKAAGSGSIEADMAFFVCTAEACVRTTELVQVPVTVTE
jgi:hypothetical protein